MVKISVMSADKGTKTLWRICMEGHAVGSEEACAGCSAIIGALAGMVENTAEKHSSIVRLESGSAYVAAICDEKLYGAFEMAYIGFLQIEAAYPDKIEVNK